jgi:pyruvate dehydrogenase complex dihydrolipoamide acetyltransferase long form
VTSDLKAATSSTVFPSVQRLIHEYSLQFNNLVKLGTGPKGRLTKGDVLKYVVSKSLKPNPAPLPPLETKAASVASSSSVSLKSTSSQVSSRGAPQRVVRNRTGPAAYDDEPTDQMRRVIAQRLTESKTTVPHAYATREINLGPLSVLRKKLNASLEDTSKLSVTDFLIRAAAASLRQVPEANSQYNPKTKDITLLSNIDISLAVALEGGLITPIIFGADKKGLSTLSAEAKDLAKRARNKGLKPHEYQGGTFSISNLGMFGITEFSAVINPPQAMILAVGGPIQSTIPSSDASSSALQALTSMRVTLSYDARAVDGDIATKWLDVFQEYLANPTRLML